MKARAAGRGDAGRNVAEAVLVLCLLVPITWGASVHAPWDVDNLAPGPTLRALAQHFAPGWYSSYGPVPYFLLGAVSLPVLAFFKLTGELGTPTSVFPWGFRHPQAAILALTVAARLVSVAMAWAIVRMAARREGAQRSPAPGWTVALLFMGAPAFAYYARTTNVDVHYLFWLWAAFHLVESPSASLRRLAAGAACAALAVCSKEQSAPFAAVACVAAVLRARASERDQAAGVRSALLVLAVPVLTYAIVWQLPFNLSGWIAHHRFLFEEARYPRTYPLTFAGVAGLLGHAIRLLPVTFGWLLLGTLALGALMRVSLRGLGLRVLASALYLASFVISIGYVYPRFLLPILLLLVPLGARGVRDLALLVRGAPGAARAILAVAITLSLAGAPALSLTMLGDPRLAVERWLKREVPPGATIEMAGSPGYQPRLPLERVVIHTRADSLLAAPHGPRGDVVLMSAIDLYTFQRDPRIRAVWWDSLAALGAAHAYHEIVFHPPPAARFNAGLPVAPTMMAWVRAPAAAP